MKHTPLTLLTAATIATLLAACDIHSSDNGQLDGFWQLSAVDTLSTGGHCDMRTTQTTWAVQGDLMVVSCMLEDVQQQVLFRFTHDAGRLTLSDPRVANRDMGDTSVTDVEELRPYGVNRLEETFTVLSLTGKNMELQSADLLLHFRKY